MKALVRWGKFSLIGAMGMVVQLGSLWVLNRCFAGHYLVTSALAVELAVLHNFVWHTLYTWPERRGTPRRMLRFHLANGLISIIGNLVLMRLFCHELHMPLLLANVAAIGCCSVINFSVGDRWVFAI